VINSFHLLVEELTIALGGQWVMGATDQALTWCLEWRGGRPTAIRIFAQDDWLADHTIQVEIKKERIKHWRLLDEDEEEAFAMPYWKSLKESLGLAREYIDRQQRIKDNLQP
jgi:hypothetical protein